MPASKVKVAVGKAPSARKPGRPKKAKAYSGNKRAGGKALGTIPSEVIDELTKLGRGK